MLELDVTKSGEQIKLENTALADIKSIDGAQMEVSESSISSGIDSQANISESSSMPINIDTSSRSVGDTSVLATGVEKEIIFKSTSTTIFTSAQDDVDKSVGVVTRSGITYRISSYDGATPRCLGFGINYRTSIYDGTTTRCLDSGINYCTSIYGGTTSRCIGTNI
jgi:hypothetical protein